jgi:hypothetical protein
MRLPTFIPVCALYGPHPIHDPPHITCEIAHSYPPQAVVNKCAVLHFMTNHTFMMRYTLYANTNIHALHCMPPHTFMWYATLHDSHYIHGNTYITCPTSHSCPHKHYMLIRTFMHKSTLHESPHIYAQTHITWVEGHSCLTVSR